MLLLVVLKGKVVVLSGDLLFGFDNEIDVVFVLLVVCKVFFKYIF